jgi:hypothetical protein
MSIPKSLTTAIAIFRELGWDAAQPEDVMSLPLGTPEQRKAAKAGLSKGEWGAFRQITGHSYGFVSDIDVDANMLGAFAIRVGVPVRRAVAIAPVGWEQWPAPLRGQLFASRGEAFVSAFAAGGGRANFHTTALAYAFALSGAQEVPSDTRYLESWAFLADRSFKPEDDGTGEKVPLDILRASFAAHLRAVLASGMPAPGAGWSEPILATVIREGIQRGWFDVAEARDLVLFAMDQASRPSDRLAYARALLEELQVEREWLVERSGILLSTMSQGPDQVVTLLGPIVLNSGDDDAVLNAMLIGVGAKSAKAVAEILHVALDIAPPPSEIKSMIAEGLAPLLTHKNAKVAKTAQRVLDTWNVTVQPLAEPEPEGVRGLWQPTPAALDVPLFELGPTTPEHLTALAARIVANNSEAVTLDAERLLWSANALARQDEDAVRTALRGVKNTWLPGLRAVREWVKGHYITTRDEPTANWSGSLDVGREDSVFRQLGAVPNLLSTPTWDDYRIDPAQLADRLDAYVQAAVPVIEADLQMALPRLDLTLLTAETTHRLGQYDLAIQLPDGNLARNATGQPLALGAILTQWIDRPVAQPESIFERSYYSREIEPVPALADLPPRYTHIWATIDLFPNWTNAHVPRQYAAPATLRKQPNAAVPATQLLNTVGEDATDLDATILAWQNGMLHPGVAQAPLLGWQGTISSLAARVTGWSELADAGLLSVIWPLASDVIAHSSNGPRVAPGVAELVDMLTRYLPEVEAAIASGLASPDVLAQPAIRALAVRGGSSRAVAAAKRLVALLPEVAVGVDVGGAGVAGGSGDAGAGGALGARGVEQVGLSDQEFAQAWRERRHHSGCSRDLTRRNHVGNREPGLVVPAE